MKPEPEKPEPEKPDWAAVEPGLAETLDETRSILAHARHHRALIAVLTTALIGLWCLRELRTAPAYEASMVFRIVEGDLGQGDSRRLARVFKSYVSDVALNSAALVGVMRRHQISPLRLKLQPDAALADFREDIDLQIWRNYLSAEVGDARSARLGISYTNKDPEVAWDVVTDIGRIIVEGEEARRNGRAAFIATQLEQGNELLRTQIVALEGRLAELEVALTTDDKSSDREHALQDRIEISNLRAQIYQLQQRAAHFDALRAQSQLTGRAEGAGMGLQFELIDTRHPQLRPRAQLHHIERDIVLGLLVILPLCALGVGAF